jgi:thiol:disulfide interchange protein
MVSINTKIAALFVVLAIVLWLVTSQVTENTVIQFAVLLGVGAILPTLINEWREQSEASN